ncbi:hypothetical protein MNBD_DELTA01-1729 [hydrothermal vent metagenome]|uniref:Flagellar protein n=1 Tax=hydrothermal vent metagenome TaxID=652676 RepID=A0A3B0RB68_9ZZZZ
MTESYAYQMAKMLLALAVVLALFGGGAYLFKRYVFGRGRGLGRFGGSNAPVKVLSRNFIESRKNIAIVDVAGEILVLGITPAAITFLTKLEEPEAIEAVRNTGRRNSRSFIDIFQEKLGAKKKTNTDKG